MPEHLERPALYIDGAWVAPVKGGSADIVEAATGEVFGASALADTDDIDLAVAAARRALTGPWAGFGPAERAGVLEAFAAGLTARRKEIATLVSRENGMPISLSQVVSGIAPGFITGYYARLAAGMVAEDVRPSPTGGETLVVRQPVGVVAAITPWNYPQPLAVMKLAPALAAGCTVVLKPPPETALDAFVFAEVAAEAGLPPGVLNVVPGGREAGAHLVEHPGVDKVAFTGSTGAGRAIGETTGRLLRPATLELGGKSVSLVADDADLDLFAARLLEVSLPNNGQTCHAATRILAPRSRYDEVVAAVTDTVAALRVGDPLDRETQVGPLVSAAQQQRVLEYVALGRSEARLTTGGGRPDRPGWFVEPTVFADVDNRARIAQEEIFGPVLCVTPYDDEDQAIAIANDSDFGLGGVVWTSDADRGLALARRIESGTVGVNHYELHVNAPFGGIKASGVGRELGPEGLEPYLVTKSIYRR
ncbi:aldehyde dehydrogenase [Nocardioides daeguensis]|uniref:Aldehyde dehydrogenase n=1 Tax=Nocardioides daeguensis TaxID=908359 RepID=A0ABP6V6F5_9ACTN|nr:aldehyde dehydrogenase [Nocardioides daeguensis]MBV6726496.1 aldehyde dehydrogenase [Nocardioides daeguensis]MCR1772339.1 aldehyde dehydrogenase [Nocardioides daeguensis]